MLLGARAQSALGARQASRTILFVDRSEPGVEPCVDDHQEYEPGVVHGYFRHARIPMNPQCGDFLVTVDDAPRSSPRSSIELRPVSCGPDSSSVLPTRPRSSGRGAKPPPSKHAILAVKHN